MHGSQYRKFELEIKETLTEYFIKQTQVVYNTFRSATLKLEHLSTLDPDFLKRFVHFYGYIHQLMTRAICTIHCKSFVYPLKAFPIHSYISYNWGIGCCGYDYHFYGFMILMFRNLEKI